MIFTSFVSVSTWSQGAKISEAPRRRLALISAQEKCAMETLRQREQIQQQVQRSSPSIYCWAEKRGLDVCDLHINVYTERWF